MRHDLKPWARIIVQIFSLLIGNINYSYVDFKTRLVLAHIKDPEPLHYNLLWFSSLILLETYTSV